MAPKILIATLIGPAAFVVTVAGARPASSEATAISAFVKAWDAADSASLAQLFEPDGRLVIPTGSDSSGREAIHAFYSAVFERGYRGSKSGATISRVTKLTSRLSLIEGDWSIRDAKQADGSPRAPESGQFSTIVRADADGWHIIVLREMTLAN